MIHQLTPPCIAVKVPEDASDFKLHYSTHWTNDDVQKLVFSSEIQDPLKCGGDMIHLPPGQWQILSRASELTEEQWKGIVGWFELAGKVGYRDYSHDDPRFPFANATESGLSLLKSKGLNPDEVLILINDKQ